MEISASSILMFTAILLTGLSAGLFYAWSVSVIPGTKKVDDANYLKTMQSINRAIINPAFILIFFGSIILLVVSSIFQYSESNLSFWMLIVAASIYFFGTAIVTGFGNVPLNNQLESLNLNELTLEKQSEFRNYYEKKWNRLHTVRTVFAVLSFSIALLAAFV